MCVPTSSVWKRSGKEGKVFIGQPVSALPELHTDIETTHFNFPAQTDEPLLF